MFSAMFPSQEHDPPAVLLVQNVLAAQHHANPVNTLRKSQDDDLRPLPPQHTANRSRAAPKHVPTFPVPRPHRFISNQASWKPDGPASECKHKPQTCKWEAAVRMQADRNSKCGGAEVHDSEWCGLGCESLVMFLQADLSRCSVLHRKKQQVSHA
jgi:hypothetical protein